MMIEIKNITVGSLIDQVCTGLRWSAMNFFSNFHVPRYDYQKTHFSVFFKLTELNKKYQRCFVGAYNILK
jgi:hypothetical protein